MPKLEHFDTIIVGGGVAGGSTAKFLTAAGKRCVVLEAGDMPRWSETCSGIFGETFRVLEQTPEAYPGEILTQDKRQTRIFFGGRRYGSLPQRWTKPLFDETLYFTLRGELEAWILSQSDAALRPRQSTFFFHSLRLDYFFFRLGDGWRGGDWHVAGSAYGSDHRPLVSRLTRR